MRLLIISICNLGGLDPLFPIIYNYVCLKVPPAKLLFFRGPHEVVLPPIIPLLGVITVVLNGIHHILNGLLPLLLFKGGILSQHGLSVLHVIKSQPVLL